MHHLPHLQTCRPEGGSGMTSIRLDGQLRVLPEATAPPRPNVWRNGANDAMFCSRPDSRTSSKPPYFQRKQIS